MLGYTPLDRHLIPRPLADTPPVRYPPGRQDSLWADPSHGQNPPPLPRYYGIQSTSGRYASYWNAYLLPQLLNFYYHQNNGKKTGLSPILSVIHTVIIGTMLNYTDGKKRTPTKNVTCKQTFIDYVRISVSLLSQ